MISIEDHVQSAVKLTNSLVIKLLDNALAINKGLIIKHNQTIPSDRREWKYFKNLAGERHSTNKQVDVTVIELGAKRPLTKELLEEYRYTKQELLKVDSTYNELISIYPNEYLYIQGCIYPVDKVKAIQARDGEILAYNENLVEPNEYELIPQIQEYIYNFLQRWHVRAYTLTDELYLPYIMSILYATLPSKIINLRINNIGTNQAHSFHLEHFFRSNINIWNELKYLKSSTIYWLYKNLLTLNNNIGKNEVFDTIIDKIITDNELGIGAYYLRSPNTTINKDAIEQEEGTEDKPGKITSNINKPVFDVPDLVVTIEPLNSLFTHSDEKFSKVSDIIDKEIKIGSNDSLKKNTDLINQIKIEANNAIKGNYSDFQNSKILELSTYELFKRNGVDLFQIIFDYWIYLQSMGKLNYVVEYIEPNNKKNYIISAKIGLLILLKSLLEITGMKDLKLKTLYYTVPMPIETSKIREVAPALYDDGYTEMVFAKLLEGYPNLNKSITSVNNIKDTFNNIVNWYTYTWSLDVNLESVSCSANIKRILALATQKGSYNLTDNPKGLTIDELIENEGVIYTTTNNFNFLLTFQAVIESFTGISIDERKYIKEVSLSFKTILEYMTSYTTQVLNASSEEDSIFIKYNNNRLFRPIKGVIDLKGMELTPLEKYKGRLSVLGNDFEEYGVTTYRNTTRVYAKTYENTPELLHIINPDNKDLITAQPVIKARTL